MIQESIRWTPSICIISHFSALVASQWLGLFLQFIGVAMVTAVAFIAVLEHHFSTVDPGMLMYKFRNLGMHFELRDITLNFHDMQLCIFKIFGY